MHINVNNSNNLKKLDTLIKKKEPVLVLYYANWCHYCQDFKPEWNNLVKKCKVDTAELESSDSHLSKETHHTVTSYPTLKLYVNGKTVNYDEQRSVANIEKFIKTNTSTNTKVKKNKVVKKPVKKIIKKPVKK